MITRYFCHLHSILKLRETGLITKLERVYRLSGNLGNQRDKVESVMKISLEHLFAPFGILLIGILLSIIALTLEIVHDKIITCNSTYSVE